MVKKKHKKWGKKLRKKKDEERDEKRGKNRETFVCMYIGVCKKEKDKSNAKEHRRITGV